MHTMTEQREIAKQAWEAGFNRKPEPAFYEHRHEFTGRVLSVALVTRKVEIKRERFRSYGQSRVWNTWTGDAVYRLSVLMETQAGFLLHGYIGKSERPDGLPDIRVGDQITTEAMRLGIHADIGRIPVPGAFCANNMGRNLHGKARRV